MMSVMAGGVQLHQLQTYHGTVVFLDDRTGELRHGSQGPGPSNALLLMRDQTGHMVYSAPGAAHRGIRIAPGLARTPVRLGDRPLVLEQPLNLIRLEDGSIALDGEGYLLCAESDGCVTLSRRQVGLWERFRLVEATPTGSRDPEREISIAPGQATRRDSMAEELVHVTVGYPRGYLMDMLQRSSEWYGCRFVGLPKYFGGGPFNLLNKIFFVKSYIESGDVDMGAVVMFTDAYDVVIVEHASVILEKFHASGTDILFGAESFFYPATPDGREPVKAEFDRFDSKWRYLNSGGYIGYAWAVKKMVDDVSESYARKDHDPSWVANDQPFVQEFFVQNLHSTECRVGLDTGAEIFACLNQSGDDYIVAHSRVRHRTSGKATSVLHANGGKDFLSVMERYWMLTGGPQGRSRPHDLRVARADGHLLAFDPTKYKLVPSDPSDPSTVVFLVKGSRAVLALSAMHGFLTFNPHGGVEHGAPRINLWEMLTVRDTIRTFHGTTLAPYCAVPKDREILIEWPTLSFLSRPSFTDLLDLIEKWEYRI
jgi:hypothetical protein